MKIDSSRHPALARISPKGMQLLAWFQANQKSRISWGDLHLDAFGPKKLLRRRDAKRRPWRY